MKALNIEQINGLLYSEVGCEVLNLLLFDIALMLLIMRSVSSAPCALLLSAESFA